MAHILLCIFRFTLRLGVNLCSAFAFSLSQPVVSGVEPAIAEGRFAWRQPEAGKPLR